MAAHETINKGEKGLRGKIDRQVLDRQVSIRWGQTLFTVLTRFDYRLRFWFKMRLNICDLLAFLMSAANQIS